MMKSYGLLGFVLMSALLALPARAEDTPHVFLSEINWAGSQISTADEWIELVNLGSEAIDLSHWVLTGVASSGGAIELAEGTLLPPRDTLIIANYALGDPKTSLTTAPDLVTTAISLPNSGLNILLAQPDGLVVDSYIDSGTPDFGATTPTTSIERDLISMLWQSSTFNVGLSATDQLGTPDTAIFPTLTPAIPADEQVEVLPPSPEPEVVETPIVTPVEPEPIVEPVVTVPVDTEIIPEAIPEPALELDTETIDIAPPQTEVSDPEISPENPETSEPVTILPVLEQLPTEIETVTPTTSGVQALTPGSLLINELVSDPIDSIEWVELFNASTEALDLTGSTLKDAGDHVTNLPAQSLAPGSYLVIENPNGNLNNTSETLTLLNHNGLLLDTLTYGTTALPAAQDGESLARTAEGTWLITLPTRNTLNIFPAPAVVIEASTESDATSSTPSTASPSIEEESTNQYDPSTNESDPAVSDSGTTSESVAPTNNTQSTEPEPIHRIVAIAKPVVTKDANGVTNSKTKSATTKTSVIGTVAALPDTFGKQILYLDGYEIYFNAADWPTLAVGDVVQVTGTPSTSNGADRLKISSPEDITVTGHVELNPLPIDGADFAALQHGALVSIAGQVTGKTGNELLLLTADNVTITISAYKQTGINWKDIQSGSAIVSGIARQTSDGLKLFPRSTDDVHFTPNVDVIAVEKSKDKSVSTSPLVGGGLLTGSIGALGTWYLRTRKGFFSFLPF